MVKWSPALQLRIDLLGLCDTLCGKILYYRPIPDISRIIVIHYFSYVKIVSKLYCASLGSHINFLLLHLFMNGMFKTDLR